MRPGKHREEMPAKRVIPRRAKRDVHPPAGLEERAQQMQDAGRSTKVLKGVDDQNRVALRVTLQDETAAVFHTLLSRAAASHVQDTLSVIDTDDPTRSAAEVDHDLAGQLTPDVGTEEHLDLTARAIGPSVAPSRPTPSPNPMQQPVSQDPPDEPHDPQPLPTSEAPENRGSPSRGARSPARASARPTSPSYTLSHSATTASGAYLRRHSSSALATRRWTSTGSSKRRSAAAAMLASSPRGTIKPVSPCRTM